MPIVVNLDVMMARRHKGAGELAEEIGITTKPKPCGSPRWKPCVRRWIASRASCWSTWKRNHDAFYAGANACICPQVDAIIDPYKVHGSRMK